MSKILLVHAAGAAGSWAWDKFGDEIIEKAVQTAASGSIRKVKSAIKLRWQRVEWEKASNEYQKRIQKHHGTVRILGKPDPVSWETSSPTSSS